MRRRQSTLKDWQHLGGLIPLDLVKKGTNDSMAPVFAEMPSNQFKQVALTRGDTVDLQIRQPHWFH